MPPAKARRVDTPRTTAAAAGHSAKPKRGSRAKPPGQNDPLATPQGQRLSIPPAVAAAVTSWAPALRSAFVERCRRIGLELALDRAFAVGTDCSGLEAPLLAMRCMRITVDHAFSSEISSWKRAYIEANFRPATLFSDMIRRDHARLPACDLYVCGFSCKPFSSLHNRSKLFREKEAKVFFSTLATISKLKPRAAVLENVSGIKRVMARVLNRLRALGDYAVAVCDIDPRDIGEPVSRPRVYFILVRVDVLAVSADKFPSAVTDLWEAGRGIHTASVESRWLPEGNAPATPRSNVSPSAGAPATSRSQGSRGCKWRLTVGGRRRTRLDPPIPGLSERASAMVEVKLAELGLQSLPPQFIDASQSLNMCRFTNFVPTVTPGAKIVVGSLRRLVSPVEKLLLNAIPVGDLIWPGFFRGSHFANMAGNTMHCAAVRGSGGPLSWCTLADRTAVQPHTISFSKQLHAVEQPSALPHVWLLRSGRRF